MSLMAKIFGRQKSHEAVDSSYQDKLRSFCKGQTVLLVGLPGAGKSSLINSFFYLATGKYKAIAKTSAGFETVTTQLSRHFEEDSHINVSFLDTCGLPGVKFQGQVEFLCDLIDGKIPLGTDMRHMYQCVKNKDYDRPKSDVDPEYIPTVVVSVVDPTTDIPTHMLENLQEAVEKCRRKRQNEEKGLSLSYFAVATRNDKAEDEDRQECEKSIRKYIELSDANEVLYVSNYVSKETAENPKDADKKFPRGKRQSLVKAFDVILGTTYV